MVTLKASPVLWALIGRCGKCICHTWQQISSNCRSGRVLLYFLYSFPFMCLYLMILCLFRSDEFCSDSICIHTAIMVFFWRSWFMCVLMCDSDARGFYIVVSILLIYIICTLSTKYILYSLCTVKYKYLFSFTSLLIYNHLQKRFCLCLCKICSQLQYIFACVFVCLFEYVSQLCCIRCMFSKLQMLDPNYCHSNQTTEL